MGSGGEPGLNTANKRRLQDIDAAISRVRARLRSVEQLLNTIEGLASDLREDLAWAEPEETAQPAQRGVEFTLIPQRMEVAVGPKSARLTTAEMDLMIRLLESDSIVRIDELIEVTGWSLATLRVMITHLRNKLDPLTDGRRTLINIRGQGYRLLAIRPNR
jgi:DNA-binding response OmpR family regulator